MGLIEFHKGQWGVVAYASQANGACAARTFVEGLPQADRMKLLALLRRAAEMGPMNINHPEKFKRIENDLYEFKSFQVRMPCFYEGKAIVLTHGFKKKKDDIPPTELERARRLRNESRALLIKAKNEAAGHVLSKGRKKT